MDLSNESFILCVKHIGMTSASMNLNRGNEKGISNGKSFNGFILYINRSDLGSDVLRNFVVNFDMHKL